MQDYSEQFRQAMHDAGLDYCGPIIADGKFHTFGYKNKSWYVFTGYSGGFGDWRKHISGGWSYKRLINGSKNVQA
ncbi:MAG TPA: hypothetical protein DIV86_03975 [Alphaproteobacteria bacterium]|nr:hypothetical protein [Alphaproteobacteria bacterium]